jgi:V/A-type H+/Na+-transporting ATPase subunit K
MSGSRVVLATYLVLLAAVAAAQGTGAGEAASSLQGTYRSIGLGLAVAATMVGSVLGAAYAVARIGAAVMGAVAEKPELLTRSIVYLALAEGLAVLGFAVAVMLLQRI